MITDPFGRVLVEAPVGKEAIIIAELDLGLVQIARASTPLISDLQAAWPTIQSLVSGADEARQ
jgi:predicted amidohydrolase